MAIKDLRNYIIIDNLLNLIKIFEKEVLKNVSNDEKL